MIVKNVEKKENNTAVFSVESDAAEFEAAVQAAYLKNKSQIYIPGFRKGKAPRQIVEGMYGHEVFYQDALDELAPKAYELGLKEAELRVVGAPSITEVNITDERTAAYTFSVELYPVVTLGQYKGLKAEKASVKVSAADVDEEIERIRKRNARQISVDDRAAQMGDTAKIDFDGYLNGERFEGGKAEGYSLKLGSGSFVPGFEEQLVGMKLGEEKDIDITFPEEYTPELAGKAVVFKIKLHELTVDELPALDDDFAQDVSEFDTLKEYKESVRKDLEKKAEEKAESDFRSEIMRQAVENLDVTVPEAMIAEKAEEILRNYASNFGMNSREMSLDQLKQMMGLDDASMNQTIRPAAEFQVKNDLLLEAVIDAEKIECSEEETKEYLNKIAENYGVKAEEIESYFGKDFIEAEQKKEKAANLIFKSAKAGKATKAAKVEKAEEKAEKPAKAAKTAKTAKTEEKEPKASKTTKTAKTAKTEKTEEKAEKPAKAAKTTKTTKKTAEE
ncbi:MAG: trigger factor [Oscillospiraceae bacterium]|nr:trigger factor [Oscillospiraceae bacterium]